MHIGKEGFRNAQELEFFLTKTDTGNYIQSTLFSELDKECFAQQAISQTLREQFLLEHRRFAYLLRELLEEESNFDDIEANQTLFVVESKKKTEENKKRQSYNKEDIQSLRKLSVHLEETLIKKTKEYLDTQEALVKLATERTQLHKNYKDIKIAMKEVFEFVSQPEFKALPEEQKINTLEVQFATRIPVLSRPLLFQEEWSSYLLNEKARHKEQFRLDCERLNNYHIQLKAKRNTLKHEITFLTGTVLIVNKKLKEETRLNVHLSPSLVQTLTQLSLFPMPKGKLSKREELSTGFKL